MLELKKLKSGTDIRGVATNDVEGQSITLTDEAVIKISIGYISWLSKNINKPQSELIVSVGHDSRISAQRIKKAVISALSIQGAKIIDCGLSSTPAMFMTTVNLGCDGAIQITASHHPFNRNGLKFFNKKGSLSSADIDKIFEFIPKTIPENKADPNIEVIDYMEIYSKNLRKIICDGVGETESSLPLKGMKIAVDAGNGAGGFYATRVLAPLGADVSGSQFLDPDGYFPNHIPNPEDKDAMNSIAKASLASSSDLGVIFDTDVDRAACVDSCGKEINRNRLIALASVIALEGNSGGTIVTDSVTSSGLKRFIENNLHGIHHRYKRGYKNVIDESRKLNQRGINSPLAIETSGHAAFKENYFLDDGAYLITKIIILSAKLKKENKKIDDLISQLEEPAEALEYRFEIKKENFRDYGQKIIDDLTSYASSKEDWIIADDNHEGVRISFDKPDGDEWFLLRLSVHDPFMPLNIESAKKGGAKIIADNIYEYLKKWEFLDISSLKE